MFDQDQGPGADLDAIVERFGAVVDRLLAVNLTGATDDSLLAAMRGLQRHTNRLAAADHALIAEVQQRGMPGARAYRGVADLLVEVLRLDPRTAAGRVRAAAELGCPAPRFSVQVW